MRRNKSVGDFFGLDIGTSSIRAVQLARHSNGGFSLKRFGYATVDSQLVLSDSEAGRKKLSEVILTVVGQSGIKTKNVAIGLPSLKTFTTVIDVPNQSLEELQRTMKYQVDQYVPMAINEAKVDWAFLGPSASSPDKQEVLLASTAIKFTENRLEFIEGLGFNVIAAEPDQIAMTRSLNLPSENAANFIVDLGEQTTDMAIVYDNAPRLVRSLPVGLSTMVRAAVQNLNVKDDQARQFILKFGLAPDKIEGRIYQAIEGVLDSFTSELSKSIKFFQTKYPNVPLAQIIVSGYAGVIPLMNNYIADRTNMATTIGNPWSNVTMSKQQQQDLAVAGSEFAVAVGLAQRRNEDA